MSLDDILPMMKLADDRKVREFMNVKRVGLCYTRTRRGFIWSPWLRQLMMLGRAVGKGTCTS